MNEKKEYHKLSKRDLTYILIISTVTITGFLFVLPTQKAWTTEYTDSLGWGVLLGMMGGTLWLIIWLSYSLGEMKTDLHCSRPDIMRTVFVIALFCSIAGIFSMNFVLVSVGFFSVFLFPFLDWLNISVKIPQTTISGFIYSIIHTIIVSVISILVDRLI